MKELLIYIAKNLVDKPEEVTVEEELREGTNIVVYKLRVAEDEMGKVIGKQGTIAKAIRSVMRAAAVRENKKVIVDIVEPGS